MNKINPTIRTMTFNEQVEYGLCTRGLMLEHGEEVYMLSAGTTDTLHVFQAGSVLFVLTINLNLDYIVLDWFQGSEKQAIDSVFLQGDAVTEVLGHSWHSLPLSTLSTRLIQLFA
jgi:hypothetical protein